MAGSIRSDGSRVMVHPADVHGRYATARKLVFAVLIAVYAVLPWIQIGGHPAVFIDIPRRHFYLFGGAFDARDIWLMSFVLVTGAVAIVWVTALFGRIWCGWACPQTVFLEAFYRPIERLVQGSRERRMRRNQGPLSFDRAWRKGVTHAGYVVVSLLLAHVFLAYFVSLPELFQMVRQRPAAHWDAFLVVMALAGLLYFDLGWFREQFCVAVCPYGRLQGVLIDADSLVVGYDARRGEPRGKLHVVGAGDCVDCRRCVVVCPTGIDIREGLQMDCVGCTACIDACDEIMDKVERPRGLIRYDSQRGLLGERRRVLRPRVLAYTALLLLVAGAAAFAMGGRDPIEATILRPPGVPFVLADGQVRDVFDVHLANKGTTPATFVLEVEPGSPAAVVQVPIDRVELAPQSERHLPVIVSVPRAGFAGTFLVRLRIGVAGQKARRELTARFLGPEGP